MTTTDGPTYVCRCEACGWLDLGRRFRSFEHADQAGVWRQPWTCRMCGCEQFSLEPLEQSEAPS
jgi:hypothetical protein